jgi:hypothetical protein
VQLGDEEESSSKIQLMPRRSSTMFASSRCTRRQPVTMRSSWAAVAWRANITSVASFAGVATRTIARTFE